MRSGIVIFAAVLLSFSAVAWAGEGEVVIRPLTQGQTDEILASLTSSLEPKVESLPTAATELYLPYFQVDTGNPSGATTLLAIRAIAILASSDTQADIDYYDVRGNLLTSETVSIAPGGVFTRNLRDLGLSPDSSGFARGYAVVTSADTKKLSGDYFQVTPGENFASGGRMIPPPSGWCLSTDIRFLRGGPFSGGTMLTLMTSNPRGDDSSDPDTYVVVIADEAGNIFGPALGLKTSDRVNHVPVNNLFAAMGPGPAGPAFGSLWIVTGGGKGYVQATFSAEGRYSVAIAGTCH